MPQRTVTCPECRRTFATENDRQKVCSSKCRTAACRRRKLKARVAALPPRPPPARLIELRAAKRERQRRQRGLTGLIGRLKAAVMALARPPP